jgi:hypothetical protein
VRNNVDNVQKNLMLEKFISLSHLKEQFSDFSATMEDISATYKKLDASNLIEIQACHLGNNL